MLIVGIDWATRKHQVHFMDAAGKKLRSFSVTHDGTGLQELVLAMGEHAAPDEVKIIIEHHTGALTTFLAQAGYAVYTINPKSADRVRDCYRPGGGKDDRTDAYVLADTLRKGGAQLQRYTAPDATTSLIRHLHAERHELVGDRTRLIQQVRAELIDQSPNLNSLLGDLSRRGWQRELLGLYPSDQAFTEAHPNSLHAFCRKHRLHKTTRDRLMAAARQPAIPHTSPRRDIRRLLERIELLTKQLTDLQEQLAETIASHPHAELMASLPCGGITTQSGLLAAFGPEQSTEIPWRQLASAWGVSPITNSSGQMGRTRLRRACNPLHRQTLIDLAFHTALRVKGSWAADIYQAKRKAGVRHLTILRGIAQRWVKIIHAMLRHQTPYSEDLHQTNKKAAAS